MYTFHPGNLHFYSPSEQGVSAFFIVKTICSEYLFDLIGICRYEIYPLDNWACCTTLSLTKSVHLLQYTLLLLDGIVNGPIGMTDCFDFQYGSLKWVPIFWSQRYYNCRFGMLTKVKKRLSQCFQSFFLMAFL